MAWFLKAPTLPVTREERAWIEGAFERLIVLFGRPALTGASVVPPTDEYFPEWDGTPECVAPLLRRVCGYLPVDADELDLEVVADRAEQLNRAMPIFASRGSGHATQLSAADRESAPLVIIKTSLLPYPIALIATLARQVAQARLLATPGIDRDDPHLGPLSDLVTVYYGLGIFTANSSVRYEQTSRQRRVQRQGDLSQPMWGHALAEYARLRGEAKPAWARYLGTDCKAYFEQSHAVLRREAR